MVEAEGGMIRENSIETCTLPHVKQMTSVSSMHEAGHSKPVLCSGTTQRGGVGREVGAEFRMGDTREPEADSCWRMAKTTSIL